MSASCRTQDCTVGDTGICLLGNPPLTCEFRVGEIDSIQDSTIVEADEEEAPPVLAAQDERPTLWGSLPLELSEIRDLMAERQCLLVGVVGTPTAGKTAALVSMYLRLAHGKFEGYQFADSRSLMAFEEICQGARLWGQSPPEEMTSRTKLSDGRVAGFLHVRLRNISSGKLVDFLVPDLPGEWSDSLIDTNRTDRLDFLRASHVLWLFVNGSELRNNELRMHTLNRTKLLLRRVTSMLGDEKPPIRIVVSHADAGPLPKATTAKLRQMCSDAGIDGEIVEIASFSNSEAIPAGTGLTKLVDESLLKAVKAGTDWPADHRPLSGEGDPERFMLRYERAGRV